MQRVTSLEVRVVQKDGQHMWHARVPHSIELRSSMFTQPTNSRIWCCVAEFGQEYTHSSAAV